MMILWVDVAYNCRPHKGERRAKDGSGRLVKATRFVGSTFAEIEREVLADLATSARIAPGYSQMIDFRLYSEAEWNADPLKAVPLAQGKTLSEIRPA